MRQQKLSLDNIPFPRLLWWVLAVLALAKAAPFFFTVAGDAQVHLAIAENFARARPFQYNPTGEIVVASTSPFWTIMLTVFYWLAGDFASLLLKIAVLVIWLGAGYLLYRYAKEMWQFGGWLLWGAVALWLAHTTIVANALGGLENVLSALQLLWLALLTGRYREGLTTRRSVALGLLLGWSLLTRPDGGLFALVLLNLFAIALLLKRKQSHRYLLGQFAILGLVAALVLLPWYAYQVSVTGRLLTDSSVARLYNGRLGAMMLIPGRLYFNPKALLSLGSAFLPLAAGFAITFFHWLRMARDRTQITQINAEKKEKISVHLRSSASYSFFARTQAIVLVLSGLLFFSFVVGAEAFGRYFLPLFPFFFIAGLDGLRIAYRYLAARRPVLANLGVLLIVLFLAATSLLDFSRRLGPGRFTITQVQDVVYGPANRQYFAFNLPAVIAAPGRRAEATDTLLRDLGLPPAGPAKIALTEVQLRYFLDQQVEIISLDGRTSAIIQEFIDPITGVPDFAAYFEETRPDIVHVNQWCAVGGFLAYFFTTNIDDNLVCQWQQQTAGMDIGDSFMWAGNEVVLIRPELVRILWAEP